VSEDLTFPKTQEGFEQALSVKKNTDHQPGTGDLSRGSTGGLTRGLGGVAQPLAKPKAGALINFEYDSAIINKDSYPLLDTFAMALKGGLADAVIVVCGHTDSIGSDTYNHKLSIRRATRVVDYLVYKHGIQKERLIVKAFGETMPIANNDTARGRSINRRVEFVRNN
jgi:outer membrane protein OmpA-like peptidoglycan-associated protein